MPETAVILTGRYDVGHGPRTEFTTLKTKETAYMLDKSPLFWHEDKSRVVFARSVWNEVSAEMERRFHVPAHPFDKSVLYLTDIPPDMQSEAYQRINGRIVINRQSAVNRRDFAHILAHEMGHYYARRRIIPIEGTAPWVLRQGIRTQTETLKELRERGMNQNVQQIAFSIFDEALVEETMMDVLRNVKRNIPGISRDVFVPDRYKDARNLFDQMVYNIAFAIRNPEFRELQPHQTSDLDSLLAYAKLSNRTVGKIRVPTEPHPRPKLQTPEYEAKRLARLKEDLGIQKFSETTIRRIFERAAWGPNNEPPSFAGVATLINYAYGPGAFALCIKLTKYINPARPAEPEGLQGDLWALFKNFIRRPILKKNQSSPPSLRPML